MIPPDLVSSLRLTQSGTTSTTLTQNQAVPPIQQLTELLSSPAVGQRLMASIQQLMPNGTYRAMVGQRELTLALPFSAKVGDTLELEVIDNKGRLALALVENKGGSGQGSGQGSAGVATTLSTTGRLISELLSQTANSAQGGAAKALTLNGNAPLAMQLPPSAAELAANLKQSMTQSGMFYEAHQVRWVAGELPTEALRQEPQGKAASSNNPLPNNASNAANNAAANNARATAESAGLSQNSGVNNQGGSNAHLSAAAIPRDIAPIVQQQLDALASQQFVWQGQAWPGQAMQWEISEQEQGAGGDAALRKWHTRLKLNLPMLGGLDARLSLNGKHELTINLAADSNAGEQKLYADSAALAQALADAGLKLTQLQIFTQPPPPAADGAADAGVAGAESWPTREEQ